MKYFELPFAVDGNKTTIPDAPQAGGEVSYDIGYGVKYGQDPDTGGLEIERTKFNELMYQVTLALQGWQENAIPPYFAVIGDAGAGYDEYALVLYAGVAYLSLQAANTAIPGTDDTKWLEFGSWLRLTGGTLTGALGIGGAPAANIMLDVQSTTKAFAAPRMTTVQKLAITSPTGGMMVFDTTLQEYHYYNASTSSWNPIGSAVGAPYRGLNASYTSNTVISINCAEAITYDSNNATHIIRSATLSINCATTGANGLDTGSLAANTWYYGYIIYNRTTGTIAGLASNSTGTPTLPGGYTFATKACTAFRTNASAQIIGFKQIMTNWQWVVGQNLPNAQLLASGPAGNTGTPTWVAVSVSNFVPTAVASSIKVYLMQITNLAIIAPNNSYTGNQTLKGPVLVTPGSSSIFAELTLETSNIYYAADNNAYLFCLGFNFTL